MQYLLRRLVLIVPVLFGVSAIVFTIMHVIPGDPVQLMFAGTGASAEQRQAMRHALGLDLPLPVQYVNYVSRAIRGDFGQSIHFRQPVLELILERMPATIELTLVGLIIALAVALYRDGDKEAAQEQFDALMSSVPDDPSPLLAQIQLLRDDGYDITVYDPLVAGYQYPSIEKVAGGADCLVVFVEHQVIREELALKETDIKKAMRNPLILRFYPE